ncbi:MAG: hypothetical protein ACD_63C00081G0008 [uncultured bacterium]|nr:MAG: hypothetical protein ACD_63C00081G0008 [uncultured bacterium]
MPIFKAKKIIGLEIKIKSQKTFQDKLVDIIVHPDFGAVLAFAGKKAIFTPDHFRSLSRGQLLFDAFSEDSAKKKEVNEVLKSRSFILKNKVETESGHILGRVSDFEFDDISWKIQRIFVSNAAILKIFVNKLMIPKDDILYIGKDKIIVRDGIVKKEVKSGAKVESEYVGVGTGASL